VSEHNRITGCALLNILQVSTLSFADLGYYRSNEVSLCRSLAKLGHQVTLFAPNRAPKWQMLRERPVRPGIEVVDGFTIRRFRNGPEFYTVALTPSLLREILEFDCDIIHAHNTLAPASFYSALVSRIKNRPMIITEHDYAFGGTRGGRLFLEMMIFNTLGRFTLPRAKTVIGLSSEAIRTVRKFGVTADKAKVIPNSVDTHLFRPGRRNLLREKFGIDGSVVLFIGRLAKQKAVHVLLNAFCDVASTLRDAKLVIIGAGPEESRLREQQRRLNLRNVTFLGRLPREDIPDIYPACDVLVVPSVFEPFGNVALEAMASGLPVIGTKIGGLADIIIPGETGYHIEPGDIGALTRHLVRLLTDKEHRMKMSRAARQTAVERFDDMVVARAVEKIYSESLHS
jgi:glycosyltransferase involved in cell wall biosynthesis